MNWEHLQDTRRGETCLVIGNGPSLNDIPLDFLRKYPSFGTNRIYLLEGFTPTYYVSVNPLVIEQSAEQIKALEAMKFIRASQASMIPGAYPLDSVGHKTFSYNPAAYIYEGFTVTYVCLQLAHFMGFDTVLLVGVDHSFQFDGRPNEEKIAEGADPNHFSPDYFSNGTRWNNPDLEQSEEAYKLAKVAFESEGREVINISTKTALDIFKKGDYREW